MIDFGIEGKKKVYRQNPETECYVMNIYIYIYKRKIHLTYTRI